MVDDRWRMRPKNIGDGIVSKSCLSLLISLHTFVNFILEYLPKRRSHYSIHGLEANSPLSRKEVAMKMMIPISVR